MDDRLFAMAAAGSGMAEVGISQLAMQKTEDESVRAFAEHMIRDHTEANQKLVELARTKEIQLPEGPDLTNAASAMALASCPPDSFADSYFKQQEAAHILAIGLYKAQAEHGQDEDLRQFAQETLPKLEEHLQMVRQHSGSAGDRPQQPGGLHQQGGLQQPLSNPTQGRGEAPPARPGDEPNR